MLTIENTDGIKVDAPNVTVYISGPMAGRDWDEVTKDFEKYEKMFRTLGFAVLNPCKFHHRDTENRNLTLHEDFQRLRKANLIFMMPGWEDSKGCNAEWGYACALGLKVIEGQEE